MCRSLQTAVSIIVDGLLFLSRFLREHCGLVGSTISAFWECDHACQENDQDAAQVAEDLKRFVPGAGAYITRWLRTRACLTRDRTMVYIAFLTTLFCQTTLVGESHTLTSPAADFVRVDGLDIRCVGSALATVLEMATGLLFHLQVDAPDHFERRRQTSGRHDGGRNAA